MPFSNMIKLFARDMTTLLFVFYFEHFFVIPIILIGYYH